jgi:hypothetical protein
MRFQAWKVASRMKPTTVVVVWSLGWLAAGQLAHAQSLGAASEPAPLAWTDPEALPFAAQNPVSLWSPPPLPPSPDFFLWVDYRQAAAEHGLDRPWYARSYTKQTRTWPLISLLSRCLHELFFYLPSGRKHPACSECGQPTLASMLGCQGGQIATDCGCFPPSPSAVPMPETLSEGERDVVVPPLLPVPSPQPEERQPERTPAYLPPARLPVVELAPDLVLPQEPSGLPLPRNRIPTPGERLPRNVVPPSR